MPVHTYTNWNRRISDRQEQIEPFRKYIFICEGANTETFYFRHLIDMRKQLGIHPLIDMRLWEKTEGDRDLSFPRRLFEFARRQKTDPVNDFDPERDKMVIVFDGDIFEEKVAGYEELLQDIEESDIAAVTNPGFELFLILHIANAYRDYIQGHEEEFLKKDDKGRYSYAYNVLLEMTGMNAKKNPGIGTLAEHVFCAIDQERFINQDVHRLKGNVSSNIGLVIQSIIEDTPEILMA